MKKKQRNEKKAKRIFNSRNMIGLFIIAIMILSGVGIYFGQDQENSTGSYGGHRMVSQDGYWYLIEDGKTTRFHYHPSEVEHINLSKEVSDYLARTKMLYLTFDPDDEYVQDYEVIRLELERQMQDLFSSYVMIGVTNNTAPYGDFDRITCRNATAYIPVLYFDSSGETSIDAGSACIRFSAASESDVYRLKDRMLYAMLGVIQ